MQDVPAAIAELERSVRELGLVAAYIDTDIADRTLDAPDLDDFYSAAVELDVPVFIHPSPVGQAGPPDDARLRRFDLDLLLGFSYDETLAVAALIFGGVLERHPGSMSAYLTAAERWHSSPAALPELFPNRAPGFRSSWWTTESSHTYGASGWIPTCTAPVRCSC